MARKPFVPTEFIVPLQYEAEGFLLEKLTPQHTKLDYEAVLRCRKHIAERYHITDPDAWPNGDLSFEEDYSDLFMHQKQFEQRRGFAYTVLTPDKSKCLGCVYIDPVAADPSAVKQTACAKVNAKRDASCGIAYDAAITLWTDCDETDQKLYRVVKNWVAQVWPFQNPAWSSFEQETIGWRTLTDLPKSMPQHLGTKVLQTKRLVLRPFVAEDADPMFRNWASDPEVTKYLTWPAHVSIEVTDYVLKDWIPHYTEKDYYSWAIVPQKSSGILPETAENEPIGNISVVRIEENTAVAEIGYCLGRSFWNQGFMTEALQAVIAFLLEQCGFNRIEARYDVNNPHSGQVMEKCGLKLQQVRKEGDTNNQGICDTAIHVLTADQYFAAREASLAAKGNPAELWENLTVERKLLQQIKAYKPWNRQEELDQEEFIRLIENSARTGDADIFSRENRKAHLTASAWTVNKDRTKVLMAYHNIYDSWSWLGGHADGERDLLSVAIREVKEESGVKTVIPLDENIFSIEILTVDGHEKKGDYVPSHLHYNVTYLLEADETENIYCKADENSAVAWYPLDEAVAASAEPWFRQRIYSKLNAKLREYHV